jgi:hypothetical protein
MVPCYFGTEKRKAWDCVTQKQKTHKQKPQKLTVQITSKDYCLEVICTTGLGRSQIRLHGHNSAKPTPQGEMSTIKEVEKTNI